MENRKTARRALAVICALIVASVAALPTGSAGARAPRAGILPPSNPQYSLAVLNMLWPMCTLAEDYSNGCLEPSLAMLNAGRLSEQLGPVVLPPNWQQLTVAEQLFVLTELERTARGLPADTGLAADWNAAAQLGADAGQDPTRGGRGARGFQAVWAGGEPNPIVVMADWVYADGVFLDGSSQNLGCSQSSTSGCWSHRDIVLHDSAATACGSRCAVGAAFSATGFSAGSAGRQESYAEIFGIDGRNNSDPLAFTWSTEQKLLPICEQTGDSCSWARIKVVTASGIEDARGGSQPSQTGSSQSGDAPSFAVHFSSHVSRSGHVRLLIRTGVRLLGVSVSARYGSHKVRLGVRRRSKLLFEASGTLTPGRWVLTIRYRRARGHGVQPVSERRVTVPQSA
jgi:hypothetical protein